MLGAMRGRGARRTFGSGSTRGAMRAGQVRARCAWPNRSAGAVRASRTHPGRTKDRADGPAAHWTRQRAVPVANGTGRQGGVLTVTDRPEPTRGELAIPKAAQDALAAALTVRTVGTTKDFGGLDWYFPLGVPDENRIEFAPLPGGDEMYLRMADRRDQVLIITMEQWHQMVALFRPPPAPDDAAD